MPFDYRHTTRKGVTQYLVRYHCGSGWGAKIFSKRNCGSDTNAQKKAYAFWAVCKARAEIDIVMKPQILQN